MKFLIFYICFFLFFLGINSLISKFRRGFFWFTKSMFDEFWKNYYNDQTVEILNQWVVAHSLLRWSWYRVDLYVNETGFFLRRPYFFLNNSGTLFYFNLSDFDNLIAPYEGQIISYASKNGAFYLKVRMGQKKAGSYDLKLRIKSERDRYLIEKILKQHARERKS